MDLFLLTLVFVVLLAGMRWQDRRADASIRDDHHTGCDTDGIGHGNCGGCAGSGRIADRAVHSDER